MLVVNSKHFNKEKLKFVTVKVNYYYLWFCLISTHNDLGSAGSGNVDMKSTADHATEDNNGTTLFNYHSGSEDKLSQLKERSVDFKSISHITLISNVTYQTRKLIGFSLNGWLGHLTI